MKTKWTKADAKRAEKMGWLLHRYPGAGYGTWTHSLKRIGNRFKSDDGAIAEVVAHHRYAKSCEATDTCAKALFLCAKG